MGGVLDDDEVVFVGDSSESRQIARETAVVHRHDGPRRRGDRGGDICRIEVQVVRAENVAQNRGGSHGANHIGGGHEGQRRHDDLVARADADGEQGDVDCGSAVGHDEGM